MIVIAGCIHLKSAPMGKNINWRLWLYQSRHSKVSVMHLLMLSLVIGKGDPPVFIACTKVLDKKQEFYSDINSV